MGRPVDREGAWLPAFRPGGAFSSHSQLGSSHCSCHRAIGSFSIADLRFSIATIRNPESGIRNHTCHSPLVLESDHQGIGSLSDLRVSIFKFRVSVSGLRFSRFQFRVSEFRVSSLQFRGLRFDSLSHLIPPITMRGSAGGAVGRKCSPAQRGGPDAAAAGVVGPKCLRPRPNAVRPYATWHGRPARVRSWPGRPSWHSHSWLCRRLHRHGRCDKMTQAEVPVSRALGWRRCRPPLVGAPQVGISVNLRI